MDKPLKCFTMEINVLGSGHLIQLGDGFFLSKPHQLIHIKWQFKKRKKERVMGISDPTTSDMKWSILYQNSLGLIILYLCTALAT